MRCAAAVLEQFGEPLVVHDFSLPATVEPGGALVRTEMAGVCGTDVHLWKGELPIQLPVILGHETVGRIETLGAGLEVDWTGGPLRVGDRVTWNSASSCGRCYYCRDKRQPTRCPSRRAYGIGYRCDQPPHLLGGFAEFHYLRPGTTIFRLPEEVPNEAVIGSGCALVTAIHGLERVRIEWQDQVVIQGAGPVGIAALAVAKASGAGKVIVVGGPAHRLELARIFGADRIIDLAQAPDPAARIETVREATGGYGADVVVECVGAPAAVEEGMQMCRDGGRYLVLGHYCDAGPVPLNPHWITRKQLEIHGSWSSEPRHMRAAIEMLRREAGRYPFARLVTHRFGIEQAQQALETTARWESAKSVIAPS